MSKNSNLISVASLRTRVGDPDVRIVDCRFSLTDADAGRRAYLAGHIPRAVYANLDTDLAAPITPESGRHPLPSPEAMALMLGRLGINNTTSVVVYDEGSGAVAARAWWLLRWLGHSNVQLLDGGFAKWLAAELPVVDGDEKSPGRRFLPNPRDELVLTTGDLAANLDAIAGMRLVDARDSARFRGEIEPLDPIAGHIPGAINLPFGASLQEDGSWKSEQELGALWRAVLGSDKNTPWAVMCGSGVTACHLAVSGAEAGFREPQLYVGSWSEWIRDPGRPVALGEGPNGPPGAAELA